MLPTTPFVDRIGVNATLRCLSEAAGVRGSRYGRHYAGRILYSRKSEPQFRPLFSDTKGASNCCGSYERCLRKLLERGSGRS